MKTLEELSYQLENIFDEMKLKILVKKNLYNFEQFTCECAIIHSCVSYYQEVYKTHDAELLFVEIIKNDSYKVMNDCINNFCIVSIEGIDKYNETYFFLKNEDVLGIGNTSENIVFVYADSVDGFADEYAYFQEIICEGEDEEAMTKEAIEELKDEIKDGYSHQLQEDYFFIPDRGIGIVLRLYA